MTDPRIGAAQVLPNWIRNTQTRRYRKGETIIRAGSDIGEWIAISSGATCLEATVAANATVAVATLWFGDILGCGSPLGRNVASYEVTALADVETIAIPHATHCDQQTAETAHLYTATAARLNRQIAMRLAGNGPQRLMSVLATLGEAFAQGSARMHRPHALALPVAQSLLGQLSGLSRRQVWIYLGELSKAGWIQTSRTRVTLQSLSSWLFLRGEVELRGIACISTIEQATDTLSNLNHRARLA